MSYELHTQDFEKNMKGYEADLKKQVGTILKKCASTYAERASKYVPPMVNKSWSKSIPAKLYKRNVLYLPAIVRKDKTNSKEYAEKLREGFRFVVKGQLNGKSHKWYATTLRKAKAYTRIFNRGMFKFLFGGNLSSVGEQVPTFFTKLLAKSPNLSKHASKNEIELKSEQKAESIRIANKAWGNQAFARESIYQGEKAAKQTLKKMWRSFAEKRKEV